MGPPRQEKTSIDISVQMHMIRNIDGNDYYNMTVFKYDYNHKPSSFELFFFIIIYFFFNGA